MLLLLLLLLVSSLQTQCTRGPCSWGHPKQLSSRSLRLLLLLLLLVVLLLQLHLALLLLLLALLRNAQTGSPLLGFLPGALCC